MIYDLLFIEYAFNDLINRTAFPDFWFFFSACSRSLAISPQIQLPWPRATISTKSLNRDPKVHHFSTSPCFATLTKL